MGEIIDNSKVVTNAKGGQSYHNFGLAFDVEVYNEDGSKSYYRRKKNKALMLVLNGQIFLIYLILKLLLIICQKHFELKLKIMK